MNIRHQVYGLNGDSARCPSSTEESFWAALGAGADGLAIQVTMTADGMLFCAPDEVVSDQGELVDVSELTNEQLLHTDVGANWYPEGHASTPWAGSGRNRPLRYMPLARTLQVFGRRTSLLLLLQKTTARESATTKILNVLKQFGLLTRARLVGNIEQCKTLSDLGFKGSFLIDLTSYTGITPSLEDQLSVLDFDGLIVDSEEFGNTHQRLETLPALKDKTFNWVIEGYTPCVQAIEKGCMVISHDVLTSVEALSPPATVFKDSFAGKQIDRSQWTAGYSHVNTDTEISQQDGIHISIKEGGAYSGAAVVTTIPVHGDFDATVEYEVASPHQGTTFELAAIGIDPGYYNIRNEGLTTRKVNLTFDVHGAPPYASSECDEDDGHRLGWNNGFNLTKIDDDWSASSVNMYNKYRRDVGAGASADSTGKLRLKRSGSVFTAYYQDSETNVWVCSGSALLQNLGDDAFIRLAAKHWKKKNPQPPGNKVSFYNFSLRQF